MASAPLYPRSLHKRRGSSVRSLPQVASNSSWHGNQKVTNRDGPFGPALAEEVFGLWEAHMFSDETVCEESGEIPLTDPDYAYQLDLPLESQSELEERLRREIVKFERGYHKMMIYAMQWYHLMEECEDNAQLEKMFRDMQMIRKLTGSEAV